MRVSGYLILGLVSAIYAVPLCIDEDNVGGVSSGMACLSMRGSSEGGPLDQKLARRKGDESEQPLISKTPSQTSLNSGGSAVYNEEDKHDQAGAPAAAKRPMSLGFGESGSIHGGGESDEDDRTPLINKPQASTSNTAKQGFWSKWAPKAQIRKGSSLLRKVDKSSSQRL
ncbi:hypothetical protein DFJ43DRAFT_481397 [Lentinula guzmanii]|uniref:RxLR effector candidate protein n=1 Tax=Lentinula guzmanii TaxID=2804957 RepID=A0AA38MY88_9AGAR|nr:hypothetical protein DFJ43DRAFT_481397 [Lentinula guzmanii]